MEGRVMDAMVKRLRDEWMLSFDVLVDRRVAKEDERSVLSVMREFREAATAFAPGGVWCEEAEPPGCIGCKWLQPCDADGIHTCGLSRVQPSPINDIGVGCDGREIQEGWR